MNLNEVKYDIFYSLEEADELLKNANMPLHTKETIKIEEMKIEN